MGLFNKAKREPVTTMHMEKPASTGKTARDPVCGMEVNVDKAPATSVYQGQTYYFCAPGCKREFDNNPAKYVSGAQQQGGHGGHGGSCCM